MQAVNNAVTMLYAIADGDQCWLPLMINKKKFRSLPNKQKRRLLRLVETRKGCLLFFLLDFRRNLR